MRNGAGLFCMVILALIGPGDTLAAPDLHELMPERGMDASRPAPSMGLPKPTRRLDGRPVSSAWFWREISPKAAAPATRRWGDAVRLVETARAKGRSVFHAGPRVKRIIGRWEPILGREAKARNLPLPLLIAVVAVESGGNPGAISPAGAGGLMQLMPQTARRFGVANRLVPDQNVRGGAEYLRWLLDRYRGDAVLALAGYNAGEGAVDKYGGVPPYRETRDYVPKVAAAYAAARRWCDDRRCEIN
ncbi:MAG: lytic transglycosylase domain-containing protein [Pseudomonadota bacterium]